VLRPSLPRATERFVLVNQIRSFHCLPPVRRTEAQAAHEFQKLPMADQKWTPVSGCVCACVRGAASSSLGGHRTWKHRSVACSGGSGHSAPAECGRESGNGFEAHHYARRPFHCLVPAVIVARARRAGVRRGSLRGGGGSRMNCATPSTGPLSRVPGRPANVVGGNWVRSRSRQSQAEKPPSCRSQAQSPL